MKLRRFYSIQQIEFCRNFVFKRNFPIHKIFERSCEMGLWEMTAHKISEVFGRRITKKLKGKLHTTLEQIAHHYELQQLRYDLRKMKAHDLVQRDGHHYTYRLTDKGVKVALLFLFFHKRLCGPLANSLFHHRPHCKTLSKVPLEAAYHKADDAIQEIIHLLKAA